MVPDEQSNRAQGGSSVQGSCSDRKRHRKTFRAGTRSPSLAGQGQFLYKEIASQLNIAYDTVHNYNRRIYEKLRVRSRGQAVAKYFQNSNRLTSLSN